MHTNKSNKNQQLGDLILNWQETICDTLFISLSILGLIAYVPSFILSLRDNLPHIAVIDTVAYGIILLITFNKKINYTVKALIGSVVFYFLGLLLLILLGPIGAGNLWLLGFSLISAFILGERAAKISFLINLATQIAIYILIQKGIFVVDFATNLEADIWLIRVVNFIVINLIIVIFTSILARQLTKTFSIQKEAEGKLADSEIRMRTIFDQSPLSMSLFTDTDGEIIEANSSFKLIFGASDEWTPKGQWKSFIHPDEIEKVSEVVRGLKLSEYATTIDNIRFLQKDGSIIIAELTVAKIKIGNYDELCYLAMIRDLTREKEMEKNQKILQDQLIHSQKMDAIGQLTGGIAHDFNNVLTGIISSAQVLKSPKRNLDEKGRKLVDMIYQSGINAAELISKLNHFSRKSQYIKGAVNLQTIIEETSAILKETIHKNIDIVLDLYPGNHRISGSGAEMQNFMMNMGINASHAMESGGTLLIMTEYLILDEHYCNNSTFNLKPGSFLKLRISDTGVGISNDNLHRIFDPFFTTKKAGKGMGLGLTTAYNIIKSHNGMITVESKKDHGTVFEVLLPLLVENTEEKKEETKEIEYFRGSETIMLIDDEDNIRISTRTLLEEMGYEIIDVQDGEKAIAIYKEQNSSVDLIILDMIMPGLSGREVFDELKQINPHVRVLVCSGFFNNEEVEEMFKQGLRGFIKKPFKLSELQKEINAALS